MTSIPFPPGLSPAFRALADKAIARHGSDIFLPGGAANWYAAFTVDHKHRLMLWYNTKREDGKEDTHIIVDEGESNAAQISG